MPNFINAQFLPYLLLGLIPLIIYLINRQRYRRMRWAAMEFLLRAMQKNQRRLRLENLLLLIVRTLAVLFFVLAFLRPAFEEGDLPMLSGTSRSEIIIIDRSYSMQALDGSHHALDEALALARQRLVSMKKGDRVQVVRAGGFPEMLYSEPLVVTADGAQPALLEVLDETTTAYESLDLPSTLHAVAAWVDSLPDRGTWGAHLYTDLQKRDWLMTEAAATAPADAPAPALGGAIPAVQEGLARLRELEVPLLVHPVGAPKARNATVMSLSCEDTLLCVDLPTSFQARIDNRSNEALPALEIELYVDDEPKGGSKLSLDPNESKVVSFPYVFRERGLARVRVVLRADDLEEDNTRHRVFEVRESVRVLLVDGSHGAGSDADELDVLRIAIGPDDAFGRNASTASGARLTPFRCDTTYPDRLGATVLEDYDVLVLFDVAQFDATETDRIENFLRANRGVLVFLGERANQDAYGKQAWRGGGGWFPYRFGEAVFDRTQQNVFKLEPSLASHPAISFLVETPEAGLSLVRVIGYRRVESAVDETAALLRLDDYARTPALVEHAFEGGTTLVMNTVPGPVRRWNNFHITPALVCMVQEALPWLAARGEVRRNLAINEPYQRLVTSKEYAAYTYLFAPDSSSVPLVLKEIGDGKNFRLDVPGQAAPGAYEVRFTRDSTDGKEGSDWFAVNAPAEEGFLARVDSTELAEAFGSERMKVVESEASVSEPGAAERRGGEVWRALLWCVLGLLVFESVLARWFGSHSGRGEA